MSSKKRFKTSELLNHPTVLKVTDNVSAELQDRRQYSPTICKALSKKFSRLQPTDEFHFTVDKEAQKQLPDIIDNTVQKIQGLSTADATVVKTYQQKRNIGIVFSGGPAPGGHNVIAGLYDAAKRANKNSKVYGFLVGPDGIIENEALELNDDLVDAYRRFRQGEQRLMIAYRHPNEDDPPLMASLLCLDLPRWPGGGASASASRPLPTSSMVEVSLSGQGLGWHGFCLESAGPLCMASGLM